MPLEITVIEAAPPGFVPPVPVAVEVSDRGPTGPQGERGEKGDKGDKGDQGDPATNFVTSVSGRLGDVVVTKIDVGLANVDDVSAADLRDRSTHTGTQPSSTLSDSTVVGRAVISAADKPTARAAIDAGTSDLVLGTTAGTAAEGNDPRLSDQRVPQDGSVTAAKLANNAVVNRTLNDGAVTDAKVSAANKDGAAGTPSMRTLGTGASQALSGSHATETDPHPQYLTEVDGDVRYDVAGAAAAVESTLAPVAKSGAYADLTGAPAIPDSPDDIGAETVGAAAAAITAHEAEVDPHPAYTTAAEAAAVAPVQSVAGRSGAVVLGKGDVGLGSVDDVSAAALRDRSTHTGSQTAGTISDFTEAVQDAVAALLGAGSNVTLFYDDDNDTLTVSATGGTSNLDEEAVRDAIGLALVGVGAIGVSANDELDTITISTTATVNSTDAQLRDRATHTGSQAIATITGLQSALDAKVPTSRTITAGAGLTGGGDLSANRTLAVNVGTTAGTVAAGDDTRFSDQREPAPDTVDDTKVKGNANISLAKTVDSTTAPGRLALTSAERTKLTGVQTGATANSTDAQLRDRSTHTGTQPTSSVDGLQASLDTAVRSVRVNSTTYSPTAGLVDLGTIAGGSAAPVEVEPGAWRLLDAVTASNVNSVTIPLAESFERLRLLVSVLSPSGQPNQKIAVRFNGDVGANYSQQTGRLYGTWSATTAATGTAIPLMNSEVVTPAQFSSSIAITQMPGRRPTVSSQGYREQDGTTPVIELAAGSRNNTEPITSITILLLSGGLGDFDVVVEALDPDATYASQASGASGASMSRSLSNVPTASGLRIVVLDTVERLDAGFTADTTTGTITVAEAGWYLLYGSVRFTSQSTGSNALWVVDATTEDAYIRGPMLLANATDLGVSGPAYLAAGAQLKLQVLTGSSVVVQGDTSKRTSLRVIRLSASGTSTSSPQALDSLTDVDTTGAADAQALVYDAATSTWVPGSVAVGGDPVSAVDGQILRRHFTSWTVNPHGSYIPVPFTSTSVDTGFFTTSGNNVVVPAGVSHLRLTMAGTTAGGAAISNQWSFYKNGVQIPVAEGGIAAHLNGLSGEYSNNIKPWSTVIAVAPGDLIGLWVFTASAGAAYTGFMTVETVRATIPAVGADAPGSFADIAWELLGENPGTSLTGWNVSGANWSSVNGFLQIAAASNAWHNLRLDSIPFPRSGYMVVEMEVELQASMGAGDFVGVGLLPSTNAAFGSQGNGIYTAIELQGRTNLRSDQNLATSVISTHSALPDGWHKVTVLVTPSTIYGYVNGVFYGATDLVLSATASYHLAVGVYGTATVRFRKAKIYRASIPVPVPDDLSSAITSPDSSLLHGVVLTKTEHDALVAAGTTDPKTLYLITGA